MMEKRKILNKKFRLFLFLGIIAAISLDFIISENAMELGTFRMEADFDAITSATTKVAIVTSDHSELSNPVARTTNPNYAQVEEMVKKAIELQGGFEWVVNKGNTVLLKVNLVGANSPSGQGENTDVRVVKALIRLLNEYTEGDVKIIVAEGTARANDDPNTAGSVWENSGYKALLTDTDLTGINFSLLNINQSIGDLIEIDLGSKGTCAPMGTKYHVHRAQLEADVYISVPVLKIHDTGITSALKNQIGTAPGCYYGYNKMAGTTHSVGIFHDLAQRRWTTESIVDLCAIADIDFVVVDALMCLETKKSYANNNQLRMNTIIAGSDPVAVDHVCAKLFDINPDDVAHITLAEKIGLGTNNPEKIQIKGSSIANTMKRAKKNTSENGKFGQSNRTWILSKAFEGTDINTEYLPNEASLLPEPGAGEWSQPVYFFDDKIDLLSYYYANNSAKNIATYAFTYFSAKAAQQAELWVGNQEAIKIYLNGELAYSTSTLQSYADGDIGKKVKLINLREGENSLLVKTINQIGDYSFALNICEVESNSLYAGNRVDGLKFYQGTTGTNVINVEQQLGLNLKCFPNPATTNANIQFKVEKTAPVLVQIFNIKGELIETLMNNEKIGGNIELDWNLKSTNGNQVSSGIYICKITIGRKVSTGKIVVQ